MYLNYDVQITILYTTFTICTNQYPTYFFTNNIYFAYAHLAGTYVNKKIAYVKNGIPSMVSHKYELLY